MGTRMLGFCGAGVLQPGLEWVGWGECKEGPELVAH